MLHTEFAVLAKQRKKFKSGSPSRVQSLPETDDYANDFLLAPKVAKLKVEFFKLLSLFRWGERRQSEPKFNLTFPEDIFDC